MRTLTGTAAIHDAMMEELQRDENVVLLGEDVWVMGSSLGTSIGFKDMFPRERVMDTPICESAQASFALGLAMQGKHVILEIMIASFGAYAFDGFVNQMAKQRYISGGQWSNSVTVRMPHGGGIGVGAHHSAMVESWYTSTPGLRVLAPSAPKDCYGLLKTSIRGHDPVIILEPIAMMGVTGDVPDAADDFTLPYGKASVLQEGSDVTIIGYQYGLFCGQNAAEELAGEGVSCEIIDLVSLVPYDKETILKSVKKTGRAVLVTEGTRRCSYLTEVASFITENAFSSLKGPVVCVGNKNYPIPYSSEQYVRIDSDQVKAAVHKVLGK